MTSKVRTWRNLRAIALMTIDTLFWSKKTLFVAFLSLAVIGLAVLARLILAYRWVHAPYTPAQAFATLMSTAVLHFLVVFVSLFYATALISDEVEGKTLTYLVVRPIPKSRIMLGKYLAYVWISLMLVVPVVVACYVVLYLGSDPRSFLEDAALLARDLGIVALALAAYGALFACFGAAFRHPILAGLVYGFGWEGIASYLPGFTRKLTVTHYLQSIFPHEDTATAIALLIGQRAGTGEAILMLVLMTAFFLVLSVVMVRDREYVI